MIEQLLQLLDAGADSAQVINEIGIDGIMDLITDTLNAIKERDETIKALAKEAFND